MDFILWFTRKKSFNLINFGKTVFTILPCFKSRYDFIVIFLLLEQAHEGGEVRRGDIIKKIADYDARDLRHEDAQTLFKNAGNTISLVIER